jgi:hypothetical protein
MPPNVEEAFELFSEEAHTLLLEMRQCIFEIATSRDLGPVSEELKWGQPSYSVKSGSPVRFDWNDRSPGQCQLLFHCQTRLVETFREIYSDCLNFEGNRAIVLKLDALPSRTVVTHCLELALTYKRVKHLPLLGM